MQGAKLATCTQAHQTDSSNRRQHHWSRSVKFSQVFHLRMIKSIRVPSSTAVRAGRPAAALKAARVTRRVTVDTTCKAVVR